MPRTRARFETFNSRAGREAAERWAELSEKEAPFPGERREERWPEVLAHYASIRYLRCDPLDEFVMLARQLIKISAGDKVEEAKAELDEALNLIGEGKRSEAARHAVRAYQTLYFPS